MNDDLRALTDLDRLIHEPARLLIVTILSGVVSADFLFLQHETGLTKGNLSAHLSKLEEAGYVKIEKTFKGKLPLTVCKVDRYRPEGIGKIPPAGAGVHQENELGDSQWQLKTLCKPTLCNRLPISGKIKLDIMETSLIELKNVSKTYSTAAGDFIALRNVDLKINSGEFVGIVGKSGAGKSTLLNMINGVDDLSSGEVIVTDGGKSVSVHNMSEDQRALWRGQNMGVVYQSFQLLPMLTLIENITLPMDLADNYKPRESRERAMQLLQLVELEEHAHKLPSFISGGQQQRVAIARALANDPSILVADEPTGSLDSITADHIFEVFEHLVTDRGKTIIMVTHDSGLTSRFSRSLKMADGELVKEIDSAELNVDKTMRRRRK